MTSNDLPVLVCMFAGEPPCQGEVRTRDMGPLSGMMRLCDRHAFEERRLQHPAAPAFGGEAAERARVFPTVVEVGGERLTFAWCGGFADSPRMCGYGFGRAEVRWSTADLDCGLMDGWIVDATPPMPPCDGGDGACEGAVEWRFVSDLRSRPLCLKHQKERLARRDRALEYSGSIAPAWFDEANAGERWDDDY